MQRDNLRCGPLVKAAFNWLPQLTAAAVRQAQPSQIAGLIGSARVAKEIIEISLPAGLGKKPLLRACLETPPGAPWGGKRLSAAFWILNIFRNMPRICVLASIHLPSQ